MDLSGLLPWQPEHLLRLLQALQVYRSALDASDTGTGKTYVALVICRIMGIIPLVVGPKGARAGWEAAAKAVGVDIEFCNYEQCRPRCGKSDWTLEKPWGKGSFIEWKQSYTMIVFDECFPAGTAVQTEKGPTPIESVSPGDLVQTPAGLKRVVRVVETKGKFELLKVTHEHGKFECTPNHKIATARGLVRAEDLSPMRDNIYCYKQETKSKILQTGLCEQSSLQEGDSFSEYAEESTRPGFTFKTVGFGKNENAEPLSERRCQTKNLSTIEGEAAPYRERRKRERNAKTSVAPFDEVGAFMGGGVCSGSSARPKRGIQLAQMLPFGFSEFGTQVSRRVRWIESQRTQGPREGQPESSHSKLSRMAATPFHEFGNTHEHLEGFGRNSRVLSVKPSRKCGVVYNIEVEDEHVYYAGEVLVSNCHRCGGLTSLNSKLLIAARRQAQYVLALSATAADDPTQMKALGYALGIHGLNTIRCESKLTWMNWQARHGVKPGVFGGWEFTKDKDKQKQAFAKVHSEVFPRHGSRMRKAEIPGFPRTEVLVKLLTDETGKAKKIAEELHELNEVGGNVMAETQSLKMKLETLMVPHFREFAEDSVAQGSKVVCFLNYTDPLFELYEKLQDLFGPDKVGYISGRQTGAKGELERRGFVENFQRNRLDALCVNVFAGGESVNLHDEIDKVERDTYSTPCESGRQYKQELGRVNRANGGFSTQYLCFFAGTYQETVAERMQQKALNVDLFNDRDLLV